MAAAAIREATGGGTDARELSRRDLKCGDSRSDGGKADSSNVRSERPRGVETFRKYLHLPLA
jgi:hypothetical protein